MHFRGKSTQVWAQIARVLTLRDEVTENVFAVWAFDMSARRY